MLGAILFCMTSFRIKTHLRISWVATMKISSQLFPNFIGKSVLSMLQLWKLLSCYITSVSGHIDRNKICPIQAVLNNLWKLRFWITSPQVEIILKVWKVTAIFPGIWTYKSEGKIIYAEKNRDKNWRELWVLSYYFQ